jgi:hypothetical protein
MPLLDRWQKAVPDVIDHQVDMVGIDGGAGGESKGVGGLDDGGGGAKYGGAATTSALAQITNPPRVTE